jgi:hypothetical protein
MSKTITIPLEKQETIEDYAKTDRNVAQVRVGIRGQWHASSDCIVDLSLSREAMIGLATALLRAAHRPPSETAFVELHPSGPGHAVLTFGVYVHPESCRLNIGERDFGELERLFQ